jgi:hypothetical protein
MDQLIGASKVTDAMPMMKTVAEQNGLKLNNAKDFKKARKLLSEKFTVIKCIL